MADLGMAIRRMLADSETSQVAASRLMGRSPNYVSTLLATLGSEAGKTASVDTLAELADTCGYDLELVPRNGAAAPVTIDPPTRDCHARCRRSGGGSRSGR